MEIKTINDITDKLWVDKLLDFIFKERLCFNCMKQFIIKNKLKNRKDLGAVTSIGFCNRCGKGGLIYYLENKIKNSKSNKTK